MKVGIIFSAPFYPPEKILGKHFKNIYLNEHQLLGMPVISTCWTWVGSVKYNSLWTFAGRFTPVNYCYNLVARDKNSRDPGNHVYTNRKSHIFFSILTKSQSKENKETFTWTFYFLWYVLMQTVSQSWLILSTTCMW